MPTSIRSSGAEKRIRSAAAVTVTTTAATNKRLSAVSTPQCFHGSVASRERPWRGGRASVTIDRRFRTDGAATCGDRMSH